MNRYHFSSVFDLNTSGPSPRAIAPLPMHSATKSQAGSSSEVVRSAMMNLLHGVDEPGFRSSLVNR